MGRGPRVYPTVGNHELRIDPELGQVNSAATFPQLKGNSFYSVLLGNVFIILNSTEPLWPTGRQADWLREQLDHIPVQADFVIFSMHVPLIADTQSEFIANIPAPESVELRRYLEARAVSARRKSSRSTATSITTSASNSTGSRTSSAGAGERSRTRSSCADRRTSTATRPFRSSTTSS